MQSQKIPSVRRTVLSHRISVVTGQESDAHSGEWPNGLPWEDCRRRPYTNSDLTYCKRRCAIAHQCSSCNLVATSQSYKHSTRSLRIYIV